MKVVLLAGGFGTRISEESQFKPKPMIEIGGKPILWHIMKEYEYYGFNEFIICAGYKQYVIKEWFADYFLHNSDITFDFTKGSNDMIIHEQHCEPWKVTVVDTGLNTMTGGRIKRVQKYVGNEPFLMTYGDGVCDVDISKLVEFHKEHGKIAILHQLCLNSRRVFLILAEIMLLSLSERRVLWMVHQSMLVIWYLILKYLIILKVITQYLRKIHLRSLLRKDNLCLICTMASGSVWITREKWICLRSILAQEQLLGKNGNYYQEGIRYKDGFKFL